MEINNLEKLKNTDIRTVDISDLVDIRSIEINPEATKNERIFEFVRQIKNPYCFRVGNVAVKVSFSETGITLEDRLQSLLEKV